MDNKDECPLEEASIDVSYHDEGIDWLSAADVRFFVFFHFLE